MRELTDNEIRYLAEKKRKANVVAQGCAALLLLMASSLWLLPGRTFSLCLLKGAFSLACLILAWQCRRFRGKWNELDPARIRTITGPLRVTGVRRKRYWIGRSEVALKTDWLRHLQQGEVLDAEVYWHGTIWGKPIVTVLSIGGIISIDREYPAWGTGASPGQRTIEREASRAAFFFLLAVGGTLIGIVALTRAGRDLPSPLILLPLAAAGWTMVILRLRRESTRKDPEDPVLEYYQREFACRPPVVPPRAPDPAALWKLLPPPSLAGIHRIDEPFGVLTEQGGSLYLQDRRVLVERPGRWFSRTPRQVEEGDGRCYRLRRGKPLEIGREEYLQALYGAGAEQALACLAAGGEAVLLPGGELLLAAASGRRLTLLDGATRTVREIPLGRRRIRSVTPEDGKIFWFIDRKTLEIVRYDLDAAGETAVIPHINRRDLYITPAWIRWNGSELVVYDLSCNRLLRVDLAGFGFVDYCPLPPGEPALGYGFAGGRHCLLLWRGLYEIKGGGTEAKRR